MILLKKSDESSCNTITIKKGADNSALLMDEQHFAIFDDSSYIMTATTPDDEYDYLSWGECGTIENQTLIQKSTPWIAGRLTPSENIPTSGSATYNGKINGIMVDSANNTYENLKGEIDMTVDFSSNTIAGNMDINKADNSDWKNPTINANWTDNTINGGLSVSGGSGSGKIRGSFYGHNAEELGGSWDFKEGDEQAVGIFRAKK
jgi:hypothetical protein